MATIESYPQGAPCYVELTSPDQEGARAFYAGLFGWSLDVQDMGENGQYTAVSLHDASIAGISGQMPGMKGHPAYWTVYLAVDDVDQTCAAVEGLGGKVELAPMDVMDLGRMAMIQDPTLARVNLWQAGRHHGSALRGDDSAPVWNELITPDVAAGTAFYSDLLGVTWDHQEMEGFGTYDVLTTADGEMWAGAATPPSGMGEIPPHWNVYFAVPDVDAAVTRAGELGGAAVAPAFDVPTVGRMAMVADPQGAMFWVMRPEPRQTEPAG